MENFFATYGTWILLAGLFLLMFLTHGGLGHGQAGGGCCGGGPQEAEGVESPKGKAEDKLAAGGSARGRRAGGCH